jgi:hypothetical protein
MTDDSALSAGARIPVKRGSEIFWATVDDEDYDLVRGRTWFVQTAKMTWYSCMYATTSAVRDGRETTVSMHRLIMNPPPGTVVDHIDHNGLNNRRSNLRLATHAENTHWKRGRGGTASRFKGLYRSQSGKWCALIECNGIREHLGSYDTEEQAARVYDFRARQLFGEFAYLNFPGETADTPPQPRKRRPEVRMVHGIAPDGRTIARVNPGSRWYLEGESRRERIDVHEAARLAALGTWHEGIPHSKRFDDEVRQLMAA